MTIDRLVKPIHSPHPYNFGKNHGFANLDFQNCIIRIDMANGEITQTDRDLNLWKLPPIDLEAECPKLDQLLLDRFSLAISPEEMLDHFWEVIGYLLLPSRMIKQQFVIVGPRESGKHEIFKLLKMSLPKFAKLNLVKFAMRPADKSHKDEEINQTMCIPFWSTAEFFGPYELDSIFARDLKGINSRAIRGLSRLLSRQRWNQPQGCIDAYDYYFRTIDHVGNFVKECCVLHDDLTISTSFADTYRAYLNWSTETIMMLSKFTFREEMCSRGIRIIKPPTNRQRFEGLSLVIRK